VLGALIAGLVRFWRDMGESGAAFFDARAFRRAVSDTFTLRYLDGGGEGCAYPTEVASSSRRWFHHLTFYGFLLCFAATTVAAIYHNVLGWHAPYDFTSVPVVLGSVGGVGLLIGPVGLLWLKTQRDGRLNDAGQIGLDRAFLALLFLTSLTGFLLLVFRESAAMGVLLAVHLGVVLGLFLTMPYGKFVHGLYRFCALVKNALEEQRR
jgi:citrate/tricarballylate utilization protein